MNIASRNRALRTWCVQHWQAFWFAPASAVNLAAARIIFAAHALWLLLSRDLPALSDIPADFWTRVPAEVHWRYLLWPGHTTLERGLESLGIIALGCAILGLVPRLACFVAGLLLYHLAPLETIIWNPAPWARGFTISVLALLTLAFSRCGDAACLVRLRQGQRLDGMAPDYQWPLRLLQLFLCQVYFFAGYSKVFYLGWDWMSSENIQGWLMLLSNQPRGLFRFSTLGAWLAAQPTLCLGIALGTPVLEMGFLLVPFWKRARLWLVPAMFFFHVGILWSTSVFFLNVPQLLIFVDWHAVAARWRQWKRRQTRAASALYASGNTT